MSIGPFAIEPEEPFPTHPGQQPGGEQPSQFLSGMFHTGPPVGTGGGSEPSSPPRPGVDVLTGLRGYYENVLKGHALVFNLDDVHCTDLCTPLIPPDHQAPAGGQGDVTGLSAHLEGIRAGKALVFNVDEIDCWALCEAHKA